MATGHLREGAWINARTGEWRFIDEHAAVSSRRCAAGQVVPVASPSGTHMAKELLKKRC